MATISEDLLDLLWHDADLREERLREIVEDRLAERPPPVIDERGDAVRRAVTFGYSWPHMFCQTG